MDRQIRRLGVTLMVLFSALFIQLNYVQVVQAHKLSNDPRNTRGLTHDFSRARGTIQTADGAVLAQSVPSGDGFKLQRVYPEKDLFAHITGFFSFTYGTEGAEREFNGDLAGHTSALKSIRDVLATRVRTGNVTLTLSKSVQTAARDALGHRKGAVVALNPADGSVLALWSWPSFDPSPLAGHDQNAVREAWTALNADANKPMLPRTYRERYFPGSTFKVVTAAAALEKAPDLASKVYPTLTELPLPQTKGQTLSNFGRERCGGALDQIMKVSCNTAFAQMGLDLGAEALADEAHAFGFQSRAPLDLPSVAPSAFPDASQFAHDLPGLAKSAIGQQDVQATPLEMALVAAGVANHGVIMKPHVFSTLRDSEGQIVREAKPEQWMQAVTATNAATLRDAMVGVVQGGTATRAAIPGIKVAAKTGTAQTGLNSSHAWLIAFAPAEAPRVVVAVIVESQQGLGDAATGGRIAAPIAQAVLRAALGAP